MVYAIIVITLGKIAMQIRVHTESGAVYVLDTKKLTWLRIGKAVEGLEQGGGDLTHAPIVIMGQPLILDLFPVGIIHSSRVMHAEVLDYEGMNR